MSVKTEAWKLFSEMGRKGDLVMNKKPIFFLKSGCSLKIVFMRHTDK